MVSELPAKELPVKVGCGFDPRVFRSSEVSKQLAWPLWPTAEPVRQGVWPLDSGGMR